MTHIIPTFLIVSAISASCGAQAVATSPVFRTDVYAVAYSTQGTSGEYNYSSKPGLLSLYESGGPIPYANAQAHATSTVGKVGVAVAGAVSNVFEDQFEYFYSAATADATFSTNLHYLSKDLPVGAPITVSQGMVFHGESIFMADAYSTVDFYNNMGPRFQFQLGKISETEYVTGSPFGASWVGRSPETFSVTMTIPNGAILPLYMSASIGGDAITYGHYNSSALYNMNYLDTFAWDGLISAFDSGGVPISDLQITGDDGTDYTKSYADASDHSSPVPEPSTYGLFGSISLLFVIVKGSRKTLAQFV